MYGRGRRRRPKSDISQKQPLHIAELAPGIKSWGGVLGVGCTGRGRRRRPNSDIYQKQPLHIADLVPGIKSWGGVLGLALRPPAVPALSSFPCSSWVPSAVGGGFRRVVSSRTLAWCAWGTVGARLEGGGPALPPPCMYTYIHVNMYTRVYIGFFDMRRCIMLEGGGTRGRSRSRRKERGAGGRRR